jgi:hypothetical protein
MRKAILLFLAAATVSALTRAQEDIIPPKRSRLAKMGLFGGFTPSYLMPDLGGINTFLVGAKASPLSTSGVFLWGGAGAAYIVVVPNLRVGGMGLSGGLTSSALDGSGIRRDADLRIGWGGVTVEYVFTVVERLDVAVGTLIGHGGLDLTLRKSNGGAETWNGEQTQFGAGLTGATSTVSRALNGSFWILAPSVNVEYAVLGWMAVRVGASYTAMVGPSWKVDGTYDLLDVPGTISGKGFMVNAGLLVGIF